MDKLSKSLKKLTKKELILVQEILELIKANKLENLNHKKLKGIDNVFRVRKGKIRIIYRLEKGKIFLLNIGRRKDDTYNL